MRVLLVKLIRRCELLSDEAHEAFTEHLFLPGIDPLAPENTRRVFNCLSELRAITNLLFRAIDLWRVSYEIKSENNMRLLLLTSVAKQQDPPYLRTHNQLEKQGRNLGQRELFAKRSH